MKVGIIGHNRCNESTGNLTFVFMPDDWTQQQFVDAVDRARNEYLDMLKNYHETPAPNAYRPFCGPDYQKNPYRTVAAIDAEWAEKRKVYEAWEKERSKAREPFIYYLNRHGMDWAWADYDYEFSYELDWAHSHGYSIDYSQNNNHDYPSIVDGEDNQ